jgi:hypothetical protein
MLQVRDSVACGCCEVNEEACRKIVQWVEELYSDGAATWIREHRDVVNDLYLFWLFDHVSHRVQQTDENVDQTDLSDLSDLGVGDA